MGELRYPVSAKTSAYPIKSRAQVSIMTFLPCFNINCCGQTGMIEQSCDICPSIYIIWIYDVFCSLPPGDNQVGSVSLFFRGRYLNPDVIIYIYMSISHVYWEIDCAQFLKGGCCFKRKTDLGNILFVTVRTGWSGVFTGRGASW